MMETVGGFPRLRNVRAIKKFPKKGIDEDNDEIAEMFGVTE